MGKVKTYTKLLLLQAKMKFKKAKEYEVPRCGISFAKMSKLAAEAEGVKMVEGQDTKGTTFKLTSKAPETVFSFASQMPELIMARASSPSKQDQKRMNELSAFMKELQPLMKDLELYQEASTLFK